MSRPKQSEEAVKLSEGDLLKADVFDYMLVASSSYSYKMGIFFQFWILERGRDGANQ